MPTVKQRDVLQAIVAHHTETGNPVSARRLADEMESPAIGRQFYSPAEIIMIDLDDNRLAVGKRFGATSAVNSADGKAAETIMKMTGGRGVDTAIEAVGIPATFELCQEIVAPGGTIANIGVHGTKVDLHLEKLWDRNITITTRLVDTVSMPLLLNVLRSHRIDPKLLITHRFKLDRILDAYDTFAHAAKTQALKVIIEA